MSSVKVTIDLTELNLFNKKMDRFGEMFMPELERLMARSADDLLETTKDYASRRPGPVIQTGQYVSSFESNYGPDWFMVWTSAPQAKRLEYGFYGTDSLGRVYYQGQYPHLVPALREVADRTVRKIHRLTDEVWKKAR